jgi:hypothetical protein
MSALPPEADIRQRIESVCFVPTADLDEGQVTEIGHHVSQGEEDAAPERVAGEIQLSVLGN